MPCRFGGGIGRRDQAPIASLPGQPRITTGITSTDMANRKLDMGKAWVETTGLIGANRDTIGAIAGLFFFLPAFAMALLAPEIGAPAEAPAGSRVEGDPMVAMQAALDQVSAVYADNWPLFVGVSVVQFIGSLSLLALLTDRARPTVRQAIVTGVKSIPSYLGAQVISAIAAALVISLPLVLLAAIAPASVVAIATLALVVFAVYMFVKFSLIAPVIVIDGHLNPITALARSWNLTKGNSLRIFGFVLLLFVTIGIISVLVSGVLGLVLSAFDAQIASIGNGLISAVVNSVIGVIFLVVIAAVHRQLAGPSPEGLAQTFT